MRLGTFFICFLLMSSGAFAIGLLKHEINIDIKDDNSAQVTERFILDLNTAEYSEFNQLASDPETDLGDWKNFERDIDVYVNDPQEISYSVVNIGRGQFGNEVKLEYTITDFAVVSGVHGRNTEYTIDQTKFKFYDQTTNVFTIPAKTDLWITFNSDIESDDILSLVPQPYQTFGENTYRWVGPSITSKFEVVFQLEKGLSEFSIEGLMSFFIQQPMYVIALVILVILIIIYRKEILGVVGESFAEEEQIIGPKKEL